MLRRPDLPVRVRIARPHHRPAILKNLHVPEIRLRAQRSVLLGPRIHDFPNIGDVHPRQRQTVVGMETHHSAPPPLPLRTQQLRRGPRPAPSWRRWMELRRPLTPRLRCIGQQCRIIVIENVNAFILGRDFPPGARIPRTQIALGIVVHIGEPRSLVDLALPRPIRPVRRH